ncbi:transposase [Micromonospora sp. NPDC047548]|uniref:transposase n=1 Tax=Micromonospora sp. NPDC047548 TaxID=3155624 RepID=UPI0033CDF39E
MRETGKSIVQVARYLGINDGTLANWVKEDREARGEAAAEQLSEDERAELARLRRGNAELAMERDALKRPSSCARKRRAGERGRVHRFQEDRA